jgi:uncharacterized membrane protein
VIVGGTGIGIAFFMFMANRSGNSQSIAVTARHVVLADWVFTTPAIIVQLITGFLLMHKLGYALTAPWFLIVISLFIFIGACWVPVVFIQYRLRDIAQHAQDNTCNPEYRKLMRLWTQLGVLAFTGIIIMFWLMIYKPLTFM